MFTQRLKYYDSYKEFLIKENALIEFDTVLTAELFVKWQNVLLELGIVNQMYLYAISDVGITVDVRCAFLIELAEPMVEMLNILDDRRRNNGGTSLKNCLKTLIEKYGNVLFAKERTSDIEKVLKCFVNSRVNIMHIKRHQRSPFLDGKECCLYMHKLCYLYRIIILSMLGINQDKYESNLKNKIEQLDEWGNVLFCFLRKLSN